MNRNLIGCKFSSKKIIAVARSGKQFSIPAQIVMDIAVHKRIKASRFTGNSVVSDSLYQATHLATGQSLDFFTCRIFQKSKLLFWSEVFQNLAFKEMEAMRNFKFFLDGKMPNAYNELFQPLCVFAKEARECTK